MAGWSNEGSVFTGRQEPMVSRPEIAVAHPKSQQRGPAIDRLPAAPLQKRPFAYRKWLARRRDYFWLRAYSSGDVRICERRFPLQIAGGSCRSADERLPVLSCCPLFSRWPVDADMLSQPCWAIRPSSSETARTFPSVPRYVYRLCFKSAKPIRDPRIGARPPF